MTALLMEVRGLHAYYGKSHVLDGVDLSLREGEILSILGRNGAGRSTLAKAIMGMVRAEGSVRLSGAELLGRSTFEIARLGVGYVPENRDIFPDLTVFENLQLGLKGPRFRLRRPTRWSIDDMYALFPRLQERADARAGALSGGEQQMLTLCRALLGDPDVMLIDEPTEGLAPRMVDLVGETIQRLCERGIGIILVEQKLAISLQIAHRVHVMGHGRMVFEGTPDQLRAADAIRHEWLEV